MKFLTSVLLSNYRSFISGEMLLKDITTVVGANETGKTNLLDAINHLSLEKQNTPFTPQDLRTSAPGYPTGEINLKFRIRLNNFLIPKLGKIFPSLDGNEIILTKTGMPSQSPLWKCQPVFTYAMAPDLISIFNKRKFKTLAKDLGNEIISKGLEYGWIIKNKFDLRKQPFRKMLDEKIIRLTTKEEKIGILSNLLVKEVLGNLRVFFWSYKPEDFLKETVPINEFIAGPNIYPTIKNMFLIAGWKENEFATKLQSQTDSVYRVLLDQVERDLNSLIRNNWSSHKNLTVKIEHKGDRLSIHMKEPGSPTPPEYRSDGLKWFLTFLINFRAKSKELKNYLLLIDEPGLYLHPRGQKDALKEIEKISADNQILYTTHQTFMISKNRPDRVRIITRETERAGATVRDQFYASKVKPLNTKLILTDRLLREALGFTVSDISPINEKNLLVEGGLEREAIYLINEIAQIFDLEEISIISCSRASEIYKHARLYKANGLKVVCFYDSDSPGRQCFDRNDAVLDSEKVHIQKIIGDTKLETFEDLFPEDVFNNAYSKWRTNLRIKSDGARIAKPYMRKINLIIKDKDGEERLDLKKNLEEKLLYEVREHIIKKQLTGLELLIKILKELNRMVFKNA